MFHTLLLTLFWGSALVLVYVYMGYPLLLLFQLHRRETPKERPGARPLPAISLFIPAFNEEAVIGKKIENALAMDYPRNLLEIIVASDGSTDRTVEIVDSYAGQGVVCFQQDQNLGKNHLINTFAPKAKGEVIVFTDSNAMFAPESLKALAAVFDRQGVGCVGGKLRYLEGDSAVAKGEGLYFRYENVLRKLEGRLGCAVGANGAIYGIRRSVFEPVPSHVPNDFFHPLVALRKGYLSTFSNHAMAYEKPTEDQGEEFNRRMRIVARSVAAIPAALKLSGTFSRDAWICLISHKILRWLGFPIMVINLLSNLLLAGSPVFITLLCLQLCFYGSGLLGFRLQRSGIRVKALTVPFYFLLINIACFFGVLSWLTGKKFVRWTSAASTR